MTLNLSACLIVAVATLAAAIEAPPARAQSMAEAAAPEVRVAARGTASGSVEFAIQQRVAGGSWSELLFGRSRFMTPRLIAQQEWRYASPVSVGDGQEVRVAARGTASGSVEFAIQARGADGLWGELLFGRSRFMTPRLIALQAWRYASPVTLPSVAAPAASEEPGVAVTTRCAGPSARLPDFPTTGSFRVLPSGAAVVVDLAFFETGYEALPIDARVYARRFDRATARSIGWQLHLRRPPGLGRMDFTIEHSVHRGDGRLLTRSDRNSHVGEGWTDSWHSGGFGWGDPGFWEPGTYRVELAIEGETVARGSFEIVDRSTPDARTFPDLYETLPWADRHSPTYDAQVALLALQGLREADPEIAASIASMPWVRESTGGEGLQTLRQLENLSCEHLELVRKLVALPWLADGVTTGEWVGLRTLALIAAHSAPTAELVADYHWVSDGITEEERGTLESLRRLALSGPLVDDIAARSWLRLGGVTEDERWLLSNLSSLAMAEPDLAAPVVAFPWLQDDIAGDERWLVRHLTQLATAEPDLAGQVVAFPWLQDDITSDERWLLWNVSRFLQGEPDLASSIVGFPWLQDDITSHERWLLRHLADLAAAEPDLAAQVVAVPWLQDDISSDERWLFGNLSGLAMVERDLASLIVLDLSSVGAAAMRTLSGLAFRAPEIFADILGHPTIVDGISDQEAAIVSTLWGVHRTKPDLVETLLDPEQTTLEERVIELPESGEVTLTIIRTRPGMLRSMDLLEFAVRSVEELMATPLPTSRVTLLFADAVTATFFGANYGTHIALSPRVDSSLMTRSDALRPIAHEVAHYYWTGNLAWVNEGVANLITTIVDGSIETLPTRNTAFPCIHFRRISDLEEWEPSQRANQWLCSYSLGERLFRDLYNDLGDEFLEGLRRLYRKSQVDDGRDECSGTPLGACHLEAAFKEGASDEARAAVDKALDFWYEKREP